MTGTRRVRVMLLAAALGVSVAVPTTGQMGRRHMRGMGGGRGMGRMGSMGGMMGQMGMGRGRGTGRMGRPRAMHMHAPGQPIGMMVDGRMMPSSRPVMMMGGQVMVPMRDLFASLGSHVQWHADSQMVTAQHEGQEVSLTVGRPQATVNGESVLLEVPPQMYGGSVYVPLRFASESLGATVRWEPETHRVAITTPKSRAAARAASERSTSVAHGEEVYATQNCASCHTINGQGGTVGPDLSHIGLAHSKQWLKQKVKAGGKVMPASTLSAKDLEALGDYLLGLK